MGPPIGADGCRLLVGLGNPGARYAATRHNLGFMVLDRLAAAHGLSVSRYACGAFCGRASIAGVTLHLAKPWGYMNRSGGPVAALRRHLRLDHRALLVVHDDLDLDFGRIKITEKGGHGGHRGLQSIIEALGGGDFPRLRVGIGRPAVPEENDAVAWVLSTFSAEQRRRLPSILEMAREAAETVIASGTQVGMNRFNGRRSTISH
jgi:PTH1 family peptidyl-tRNA hydrolase